ncbi:hypothetical protein [Vreelandella titanicae]|uniref:hypothetical protein n=1 Tax=Vreelandella titanicae TaxID=664683 RepID=UPI0039BEDAE5
MVSEAHPRKQREAVPGLACVGGDGWVLLGVVPTPPAGASKRSLNSLSRYHALRQSLDFGGVMTCHGHVHNVHTPLESPPSCVCEI